LNSAIYPSRKKKEKLMQALNAPTAIVLSKFKEKITADMETGKETPYDKLVETRQKLHPECGPGEWPEEAREKAMEAMALFVIMNLGAMVMTVAKEIDDAAKALVRGDEAAKKAAFDLAESQGFIEAVFKTWLDAVDIAAVAEGLFEAGEESEKAPKAPKPKKKDTASTLIDELMAKIRPSNN